MKVKTYKVTVRHFRYVNQYCDKCYGSFKPVLVHYRRSHTTDKSMGAILATKGGMTEVVIQDNDGKFLALGQAVCSKNDNYCYKTGRELALERAMSVINDMEYGDYDEATTV